MMRKFGTWNLYTSSFILPQVSSKQLELQHPDWKNRPTNSTWAGLTTLPIFHSGYRLVHKDIEKESYTPRNLTARPWKLMIGRRTRFLLGPCLFFRGYVEFPGCNHPQILGSAHVKSVRCWLKMCSARWRIGALALVVVLSSSCTTSFRTKAWTKGHIFIIVPSRGLTYPTLGKGKSSSKCHFGGIC